MTLELEQYRSLRAHLRRIGRGAVCGQVDSKRDALRSRLFDADDFRRIPRSRACLKCLRALDRGDPLIVIALPPPAMEDPRQLLLDV